MSTRLDSIIVKEEDMATYIALCNFTHQGITNIKGSPDRINAARELAKTCGAQLMELYLTMGSYDFVAVIDAPDDAACAKFSLALGSLGNVRTTTLKAFTEEEYTEIVKSLP